MTRHKLREKSVLSVLKHLCSDLSSNHLLVDPSYLAFLGGDKEDSNKSYLDLSMRWTEYGDNVSEASRDYFCLSLLSKYKGLQTGYDLKRRAIESWTGFELQCKATNERIRTSRSTGFPAALVPIISIAQRKISDVLGVLDLPKLYALCRWSNGATSTTKRVPIAEKMSRPIAVTRRASSHLARVIDGDIAWLSYLIDTEVSGNICPLEPVFQIVEEERFITVPKNAKTDRSIQAAPAGNAFLQQCVGRYIRERLKRFSIDLDDQSQNQRLAAEAFRRSDLATLDLKGASDTLCRELPWLLLPVEWAAFLDDLRVGYTSIDGKRIHLEKFSAMGNAFTFELESLIFWALSYAVHKISGCNPRTHLSVYGDDIVCDRTCYHSLVEVLNWFGFAVNDSKSFREGYFFESCGKHYYHGVDITPCFQKERVNNVAELIRLHNRLYRWCERVRYVLSEDNIACVQRALKELRSLWPFGPLPRIPYWLPDDRGFLSDPKDIKVLKACDGRGVFLYVLITKPSLVDSDSDLPYYAYKLRRPYVTYTYRKSRLVTSSGTDRTMLGRAWIQWALNS